jgi:pimeloyl-ACP methyl ester carboxylesterase
VTPKTKPSAPARNRKREGYAVAADGTKLYYRVHQPPEGTQAALPCIFTDGIGCDGYVWKYLEPELVRDRTIVHWHLRGHGQSAVPDDPERVTISDSADDLATVLDAAGVPRAILIGHSMGVQVSLETWRRHHDRVAGLALLCGSYGTPLRTFKGKRTLEDVLPYVRFAVHRIPRLVTALWRRTIPTDLAYQLATLMEVNGALIRRDDFFPYLEHIGAIDIRLFVDMLAAAGRHTARELLPLVDVPSLIVAGTRDGFTPLSLSEEMHRLIPQSRLHVVQDGSHTAPIERPGEVTHTIADFVRSIKG